MTARTRPLNERLRAMREAAGLSQEALAEALGTKPAAISRIETRYYDWLPAPDTIRKWATATGHAEDTGALLAMLADDKAAAARQAVTRGGRQGWCSQHRQERSQCRPDQTHVYPMRQRGDLMAEVERQAGGDINAFVTRALIAATGWEPPDGHSPPPAPRRPPASVTAPSGVKSAAREKNGSTPGAAPRPPVAAGKEKAAAAVRVAREAGHDVRTASELPAAPVFMAGPDVDCAHENLRGVKGVCPDCKQWAGRKP